MNSAFASVVVGDSEAIIVDSHIPAQGALTHVKRVDLHGAKIL